MGYLSRTGSSVGWFEKVFKVHHKDTHKIDKLMYFQTLIIFLAGLSAFTCSKLTIKTLEQGVENAQVKNDVLVFLLLTLNILYILF